MRPSSRTGSGRAGVLVLAVLALAACTRPGREGAASRAAPAPRPASCPAKAVAPRSLPGVRPEHRRLDYWLARAAKAGPLDEPLLSPEAIRDHDRALREDPTPLVPVHDLAAPPAREALMAKIAERLEKLRGRVEAGTYVGRDGRTLGPAALAALRPPPTLALAPVLRAALDFVPIHCSPMREGLYLVPVDPPFDRNLCATARPQEPVEVLATWPNGLLLARTRYVLGWIDAKAALSPPVPAAARAGLIRGPRLRLRGPATVRAPDGAQATLPDATLLAPIAGAHSRVYFATPSGWHASVPLDASRLQTTARPLTRRALLTEAFRFLGFPYGWGGRGGGRDCSRFLLDLFAGFGLELPRNSGDQARAGVFSITLDAAAGEAERLALLDEAAASGIVLLHLPGHIMLYLGRNAEGAPMAMHAFAEYLVPCPARTADGGVYETLFTTDRVAVTDLELGRGSSRRSFLERLTTIVIFSRRVVSALVGVAVPGPAAAPAGPCPRRRAAAVWVSPAAPRAGEPVKIIFASRRPLDPLAVALTDPAGREQRPPLHRLGGPPFGYWVSVPSPARGRWTARLGDGTRVMACARFRVRPPGRPVPHARAGAEPASAPAGPVWEPRREWSEDLEDLYSLFVEQLFDYPVAEDRTWPNLQELLLNREKNLLFDYRGLGEEARLALQPDCADLPYFLRAYFAWKLELPFGLRRCDRGTARRPPTCEPMTRDDTNLRPRESDDEVKEVGRFITTAVRWGVHSGSGRTHPADNETDYYPVPLERRTLRPGVVFADPYGHVIVLAKWIPQAVGGHGILMGADAQPDGTVGRRRFWRGTFLFRPETTAVGAGFKAFRPLVYRTGEDALESQDNEALARRRYLPWSDQQNRGSVDDFYDRMDALINPRPLDPEVRLTQLVEALAEAAQRRVSSVQNGERFMAKRASDPIAMPDGHAIFETTGPWEDYSTPSRDMRLLIAIDTVLGYPAEVRRRPHHYGLAPGAGLERAVAALTGRLTEELGRRTLSYVRSDGAPFRLTLADLVARRQALEMAYNPNDCIEIRWGAPEGTPERAACRRHAPPAQQARMREYRAWFHERQRPVR